MAKLEYTEWKKEFDSLFKDVYGESGKTILGATEYGKAITAYYVAGYSAIEAFELVTKNI